MTGSPCSEGTVSHIAAGGAVAILAEMVPEQWHDLAPYVSEAGPSSSETLFSQLHWARTHLDPGALIALADLEALIPGWAHYRSDQRAALSGVMSYLTRGRTCPYADTKTPMEGSARISVPAPLPTLTIAQIDELVVAAVRAVIGSRR